MYVLPFVDCSLGLPFLPDFRLRFTRFPDQTPCTRRLPNTAVDDGIGCLTASASSCDASFLIALVRNSVFYDSTGTHRLDAIIHERSCAVDHLHLDAVMYNPAIDCLRLHIELDNVLASSAWTEQRYHASRSECSQSRFRYQHLRGKQ